MEVILCESSLAEKSKDSLVALVSEKEEEKTIVILVKGSKNTSYPFIYISLSILNTQTIVLLTTLFYVILLPFIILCTNIVHFMCMRCALGGTWYYHIEIILPIFRLA